MKSPKPSSRTSSPDDGQRPIRLRLSCTAEAKLEAIDAYSHEQFGDEVASEYMRSFGDLFALLRRHPLVGQEAFELGKGMRSLKHLSHRVFYREAKVEVRIIRILHHAMDAERALRRK